MNIISAIKRNWRYLCIPPLFLTAILTAFIQCHALPFMRMETFIGYAILTLIGIGYGALIIAGNTLMRSIMLALIVSFFVLSQLQLSPLHTIPYRYILLFLVLSVSAVFYIIMSRESTRFRLDTLFVLVLSIYWAGAFFTKPFFNTPFLTTQKTAINSEENKSLPPYIHIILDEHASFDALPYAQDSYNQQLENKYIHQGFHIYPQAYSRENFTVGSFSSFLNFKSVEDLDKYYQSEGENENSVRVNKLFELLAQQGYHLNVVQTAYLDLCKNKSNLPLSYCLTYHFNEFVPEQSRLSVRTAALLNGVLIELKLQDMLRSFKNLPIWKYIALHTKTAQPITPASAAVRVVPEVQKLFKTVQPGNAYFIHLLIPHSPYVFDKNCEFVGENSDRLQGYKEQVQCSQKIIDNLLSTLSSNPAAQNSIIVIHGDHGMRLQGTNSKNKDFLTSENLKRTYSILFAVKSPSFTAGTDEQQLPLDALLKSIHVHSHPILSYAPSQQYFIMRDETNLKIMKKYSLKTKAWDINELQRS
ncbi:sulfatase-like hydrolase/transferase [Legionella saoudiensis]|uniref:sulfatase-like hydrolase/transferase n=1 Tax=Legionella saoudiensis TaxID=1750561 RepID=UPI0007305A3A|nr:sulfatase-like hydrolase/transferase [Legionella saoudiensis]